MKDNARSAGPGKTRILLLAGEESGVIYAESLARSICSRVPAEIRGYGDCGFKTADLAVMGFWPVIRKIFWFLKVARTMKRVIRDWRPHVVVTVDYPGLNLKLASYAKNLGIPAVHVVCPQVWAWHQGRIPKVAASLTKLLCFFPFEPGYFSGTDLDVKFIGHPLADSMAEESKTAGDMRDPHLVAILPGSRLGEIRRHLPVLLDAVALMHAQTSVPPFKCEIPAANAKAGKEIASILSRHPVGGEVTMLNGGARALLRRAGCAAVASGTATLEAALAGCPTVLVYQVSAMLAWFARRVIKGVKHVGLANIIAEKCGADAPMPELLQEAFTAEAVAQRLGNWMTDAGSRDEAASGLAAAVGRLKSDGRALETATDEILGCVEGSGK